MYRSKVKTFIKIENHRYTEFGPLKFTVLRPILLNVALCVCIFPTTSRHGFDFSIESETIVFSFPSNETCLRYLNSINGQVQLGTGIVYASWWVAWFVFLFLSSTRCSWAYIIKLTPRQRYNTPFCCVRCSTWKSDYGVRII